jgi:hypothetical protein
MSAAPGRATLGAVNGLAQIMSSVTRTIAPFIASSLFSISLQRHIIGGYMVYLYLSGITLVGVLVSLLLPPKLRAGW